jgi:hypothetical protein
VGAAAIRPPRLQYQAKGPPGELPRRASFLAVFSVEAF